MPTDHPLQQEFPFASVLDLSSLINYWKENLRGSKVISPEAAADVLARIEQATELHLPIYDLSVLEKHNGILGLLMSAVIPTALVETEIAAALKPFSLESFYHTPGFKRLLPENNDLPAISTNLYNNDLHTGKILRACVCILNKYYGTDIEIDQPLLSSLPDKNTGLPMIFKTEINLQFSHVELKGDLPKITPETIHMLMDDLYNTELWLKHIKPEHFEFHGFTIIKLHEVTVEEMLSAIKYDLLKKDAVTRSENFMPIQEKLRAMFKLPEMELGLTYFDPNNNVITNYGSTDWNSFMMPIDTAEITCDYYTGSIYDRAYDLQRVLVIEDIERYDKKTHIEKALLKKGIKNVAVAPLVWDGEVLGMLEVGTPYPNKLNPVSASKLESVIPMFTAAVRRVLAEMKTEVRALIQKECTAIHPTVEWKFLEEGYNILDQRRNGQKATLNNIVFPGVYPIYGLSDIRNSSVERSKAIQHDLAANLKKAKKVINELLDYKQMPILEELNYRLDQEIKKISSGLNSGDESGVLEFLKNEITPAFKHFKEDDERFIPVIEEYEQLLDPQFGVIYKARKDFEYSLTQINEVISSYLDEVELEAQQIFPHYFEKYKTDGVEYNLYIGQSLVRGKTFDPLYLKNFRLWQLITMCEIALRINDLKRDLPQPLDITQLILVHSDPLSIKFRKDEKRFDVDGAYNIRYEIVKKRIDKAYIKNTDERLTQPGKIAVVYSQEKDLQEYKRYIKYLQSVGYLTDSEEHLELEELQGAQGLKAIRLKVNQTAVTRELGKELLKEVTDVINVH